MRGCISLLMFIAFLAMPFVLFGTWTAVLIVLFIAWFTLWVVGKGLMALGEHLTEDEDDDA